MSLWALCEGEHFIKPLKCTAWRAVEAQHKSTTRSLVDSPAEHELLEQLLENNKPKLSTLEAKYHYLLATPFRYPPLKHGSRFGNTQERAIWYGSHHIETALAEVAFYRRQFLKDTTAQLAPISILLTAYSIQITTLRGIDCSQPPFLEHKSHISCPDNYTISQNLGSAMRNASVEAFYYFSARAVKPATNVGVFTPTAFANKKPDPQMQTWQCLVNQNDIEFIRQDLVDTISLKF